MTPHLLDSKLLEPQLLGDPAASFGRRGTRVPDIVLGNPGRCATIPTLLILIFDNSGSVAGAGGNDPIGNRFVEARIALEAVGRRCRCGKDLATTLSFDTPTSADVPPTSIRSGISQLENGLRAPSDGAGRSELGPALSQARRLAERYPDHTPIVVPMTDFELVDNPGVIEALCEFRGLVHAVCLRSAPPRRLVDDDRVTITHISHESERGAVAKAVFAALTVSRPGKKERRRSR